MINRIVVLGTLVLVVAIAINWFLDQAEEGQAAQPGNEPDLYMLNATINQFDARGVLQHRLAASRFTHFPLTDLTAMIDPSIALADGDASSPWKITSAEGRLLPASAYREEIVELWDNVLASKTGAGPEFINIQTNSLTVYPERDYAETDVKVYIDNQNGRTTAAGMKAFLDAGRFMFYSTPQDRVTTIFLPN